MWRGPAWLTITRDVVLMALGTAGVIHQAFLVEKPEITLLIFFAGMIGGAGLFASGRLEQSNTGGASAQPPTHSPPPPSPTPPPSGSTR